MDVPINSNCGLALAMFQAINQKDLDAALALMAEDAEFVFPGTSPLSGTHSGSQAIRRFLRRMRIAVPDLQFEILALLEDADKLAAEWTNSGTTLKGLPYENAGVSMIEFRDGRIARVRDYLDTERLKM